MGLDATIVGSAGVALLLLSFFLNLLRYLRADGPLYLVLNLVGACVPVGVVPGNLLKEMIAKVDTERGREIYHQRIGVVEPVFANIRAVKRMDRFTLRWKIKVNIQWVLYCMVHNIGKIMSYGLA